MGGDDVEGYAREIAHGAAGMRRSGGREGESGRLSGVPLGGRVAGQGDGTLYKQGASRPSCVLVSFLLHATFVARNLRSSVPARAAVCCTVPVRARRSAAPPSFFATRCTTAAVHRPRSVPSRCRRPPYHRTIGLEASPTSALTVGCVTFVPQPSTEPRTPRCLV